jgi:hypothetical protein
MITLSYLACLPMSLIAFKFLPRPYAPWICLIGGWVLLPPAIYPIPPSQGFPFWIIGSSLPSNVLINKIWIAPLATCFASLIFDARRWRHSSLNIWDACVCTFCLWPILQEVLAGRASPAGWIASLYLAGSWALPWWLGRLYLRAKADFQAFGLVFVGMFFLLLPVAAFEGVTDIRIQTLMFGEHPFAGDGVERYLGYRPQAFFEHGNQYGLWCAAATITALWLVRQKQLAPSIAAILATMTMASQSVGAIGLLLLGALALSWVGSFKIVHKFGIWVILLAAFAVGLLIAGLIPLREFVEQSGAGQALLDAIRSTGRGSFAWRVSQDLKVASLLREQLILGHGQWDWFLPVGTRPWGFPLLAIGQFGVIGLILLLLPFTRSISAALHQAATGAEAAKLTAVLMIIAALDAILNSFLLWPFVVLASPFAGRDGSSQGQVQRMAKPALAAGSIMRANFC